MESFFLVFEGLNWYIEEGKMFNNRTYLSKIRSQNSVQDSLTMSPVHDQKRLDLWEIYFTC